MFGAEVIEDGNTLVVIPIEPAKSSGTDPNAVSASCEVHSSGERASCLSSTGRAIAPSNNGWSGTGSGSVASKNG